MVVLSPSNNGTRLYHFQLVREDDAFSLFCFWALGQTSIPSLSVANPVKEVQAEWKSLLLAVKGLIGSSLHGEPLVTWKSARKKLSKGGLLGCLETSIDFLDDVAKGWFSDLPRFPDEKKNCEDAPVDIWVYIQKLKRQDAVVLVLELILKNLFNLRDIPGSRAAISYGGASELYYAPLDIWVYIQKLKRQDALIIVLEPTRKKLFNLRGNPGSRAAISHGSTSELYFSQQDVMQDAPLYIWVYIQKLKQQDAVVMVLELTLKNLFNLRDNAGSRAGTSYGSASKLYFSPKDVMRDLALYVRCQRSLVHKKRLIMLKKKHSLQGKGELLNRKAFHAEVVSVHTGPIIETRCFEMNFSETEASVFFFPLSEYFQRNQWKKNENPREYSTTVLKDERLLFS